MGFARVSRFILPLILLAGLLPAGRTAIAAEYKIDPAHSFVEFRANHLGYSWLYGRFNVLSGEFFHDAANPAANRITVEVDTTTVDTRHAERDKHLRSEDFLDVAKYPKATFKSTKYEGTADGGKLHGELTVHGVTRPVVFEIEKMGEGPDPWGGYRAGFSGKYVMTRKDFGIDYDLGPKSTTVELTLGVEGIRKK
ncbi:MAG: YceI family protein [Gammaproteobacteria bacterium]|nr:YceI family protein [Gammaproteobacteria bacterium]